MTDVQNRPAVHPADDYMALIRAARRQRTCRFRTFFTVAGAAEEIRRRPEYSHTTHEAMPCGKCGLFHVSRRETSVSELSPQR